MENPKPSAVFPTFRRFISPLIISLKFQFNYYPCTEYLVCN